MHILVDCDGVIFQNHLMWHQKFNEANPEDPMFMEDITTWDKWKMVLGRGDAEKGWERMKKTLLKPEMYLHSKFYPGAMDVLQCMLIRSATLTIVSNIPDEKNNEIRRLRLEPKLNPWEEYVTYHWENASPTQKSRRYEMGADILIDDHFPTCLKWAELHPDGEAWVFVQPWNVGFFYGCIHCTPVLPKNIRLVWGWEDIWMRFESKMRQIEKL